jgi:hypothetical protein
MEDDRIRDALDRTAPGAAPAPSVERLEEIVRRSRSGRVRNLTIALVIALLAGPALGIAIGSGLTGSSKPETVSTGQTDGSSDASFASFGSGTDANFDLSGAGVSLAAPGGPGGARGPNLTSLFKRSSDGIAIRAYQVEVKAPDANAAPACPQGANCPTPPPAECRPTAGLQAELSTEAAVGEGRGVLAGYAKGSVEVIGGGFFGVKEGDSVAFVIVHVNDPVKKVKVHFGDATDEMDANKGFAVLAHHFAVPPRPSSTTTTAPASGQAPPPGPKAGRGLNLGNVTVQGLDGSGKSVFSKPIAEARTAAPDTCRPARRFGGGGGGPRMGRGGPGMRRGGAGAPEPTSTPVPTTQPS